MTLPSRPPLEAEGLCREFGSIRAVDDLSFRVERGEVVGLLGPNGAGKTTTLRMLVGSLIPTRGVVRLGGRDPIREGAEVRRSMGYMPEQVSLYGEMAVCDYVSFVASVKEIPGPRVPEALERVRKRLDLDEVWTRPTRSISRGYRQRVGLAQALVGDPDLLILDEPTSGLDPNQIREFRGFLRLLGKEHAILLSTHILPEAIQVCDRVIILSRGRLVAMGRPGHLAEGQPEAGRVYGRIRLAGVPGPLDPGIRVVPGETPDEWRIEGDMGTGDPSLILRALLDRGAEVMEWRVGGTGLEEVFRRLTLGEEGLG